MTDQQRVMPILQGNITRNAQVCVCACTSVFALQFSRRHLWPQSQCQLMHCTDVTLPTCMYQAAVAAGGQGLCAELDWDALGATNQPQTVGSFLADGCVCLLGADLVYTVAQVGW